MNTEIFLEGQQLDITADIAALFTYAIDDVTDFGSKDTNYTKTIVLPGTTNNNRLFGHAYEFTAYNPYTDALANRGLNFNAAKAARCVVLLHGIQIFKGVLRLMKITRIEDWVEYETALFGELGGLVSSIGNRKLTDLDFSAYDDNWTHGNIIGSWALLASGPSGTGVYCPVIDYGLVSTDKHDYKFSAMRPALFVREYIDKILTDAGYTWECAFFDTDFFKRLIVPHNEDKLYNFTQHLIEAYGMASGYQLLRSAPSSLTTNDMEFQLQPQLNYFTANGANTEFTYAGTVAVTTSIEGEFNFSYGGGESKIRVEWLLKKNGTTIGSTNFLLNGATGYLLGNAHPYSAYRNFIVPNITLVPGDKIEVDIRALTPGSAPLGQWSVTIIDCNLNVLANQAFSAPAAYNSFLQFSNLIPKNIAQKDFLTSIVKMFNLCIVEDQTVEKHLKIEPFVDFFDNSAPLDWSAKLDRSKPIELTPMSELNARYFHFQYEQDSDYYNDYYKKKHGVNYGDYLLDNQFEFVKDKEDLKVIFAPTPSVGDPTLNYTGEDKVVPAILKIAADGTEEQTASKIRILQAKRLTVSSWDILDAAGSVLTSTTYYGYAGHVDDPITPQNADLSFGAPAEIFWEPTNPYTAPTVFSAFHSVYMAEIMDKDSKLLRCHVYLSPIDIYNLNFRKAIVIDGQLWRLNKVIDYDAIEEGVTKVELLKVIEIAY